MHRSWRELAGTTMGDCSHHVPHRRISQGICEIITRGLNELLSEEQSTSWNISLHLRKISRKMKNSKPNEGEKVRHYAVRFRGCFERSIKVGGTPAWYEALRKKKFGGQFILQCHARAAILFRERDCMTIRAMVESADRTTAKMPLINKKKRQRLLQSSRNKANVDVFSLLRPKSFLCGRMWNEVLLCTVRIQKIFHRVPYDKERDRYKNIGLGDNTIRKV